MKPCKRLTTTLVLIAAFVMGLSLLLYPTVANYVNGMHQTREIASYSESVQGLTSAERSEVLKAAEAYNRGLVTRENVYGLSASERSAYPDLLNVSGSGVMGYIEIPSLEVRLPVYHGTSDAVLQMAVGHVDWSSLPVGGACTHAVLSGHRGLPSSKLFTDVDRLVVGDIFVLQVLEETLTYEVDQIKIVEPEDATDLQILEGRDLCTLLTCTPYGLNTHRLLVRGHRVANRDEAKQVPLISEAVQIGPMIVAPFLAVPLLLILLVVVLFGGRSRQADAGSSGLKVKDGL